MQFGFLHIDILGCIAMLAISRLLRQGVSVAAEFPGRAKDLEL
jgi:hypothetical protein